MRGIEAEVGGAGYWFVDDVDVEDNANRAWMAQECMVSIIARWDFVCRRITACLEIQEISRRYGVRRPQPVHSSLPLDQQKRVALVLIRVVRICTVLYCTVVCCWS